MKQVRLNAKEILNIYIAPKTQIKLKLTLLVSHVLEGCKCKHKYIVSHVALTFTGPDLSFDTKIWPMSTTVKLPVFYEPREHEAMKESKRGKESVYGHYSMPKYTHFTAQQDLH